MAGSEVGLYLLVAILIVINSVDLHLLLELVEVDASNGGLVAIDDLGQLFESWTPGLDVHEVDEDELEEDPALLGQAS